MLRASQQIREIVLLPSLSLPITSVIGQVNSALSVFSMMSIFSIDSMISRNRPIKLRGVLTYFAFQGTAPGFSFT